MKNILKGNWLFDSQILIYALDGKSPFHQPVKELFLLLEQKELRGIVAQQNILEAESVFLRHYRQKPKRIITALENLIQGFKMRVITPLPTTYLRCHSLIKKVKKSFDLFDFFLAATMLDNGFHQLITANDKDFAVIREITVYNPFK